MTDLSTFDFCKLHKELKEHFKGESPNFGKLISVISREDAYEIVKVMKDLGLIKVSAMKDSYGQHDFVVSIL